MSQKKFKFQTHHFTSVSVDKKKKESRLFLVFFYVGSSIIKIIKAPFVLIAKDFQKTAVLAKKRSVALRSRQLARNVLLFLIFSLFGWGLFRAAGFLAAVLDLKNSVYSGVQAGVAHLTQAGQALATQNTALAGSQFVQAENSFVASRQQLDKGNAEMLDLLDVLPQTQSAKNLLDAASLLSQSGQDLVKFYSEASTLSFSVQGLESTGNTADTINSMDASLNSALAEISSANQKLVGANLSVVPSGKQREFLQLSSTLASAQIALNNLKDVFGLLQQIVMPKGTVLLLFENNNELRPGGGFIGTYGDAAIDGGKINNLTISSIYDVDGQLKTYIAPPEPILNVNDRWFLRDSNWFADFPTDARKAGEFYAMEGGQAPDTIIALTPNVIVSLLQITGPVSVPDFKVTLNADNFVEQTQAISTVSDDLTLNQPKQILADFFPLFMQKLKTLTPQQSKQVLAALLGQLEQKQIVLESDNPAVESQLESFNWAGQVATADRDYLQMVSANLGGTKTDLSMQKKMDLATTIDSKGDITDDLTVTLTDQQPQLADTENTSFIRFLVPQGSQLVSVTGFDQKNLYATSSQSYRQDPDVAAWENGMVKDVSNGMLIGTESGKTFFGNWLTVLGGQTRIIRLVYKLPFILQSPDRYSLVLQKQIGSVSTQFNWSVQFSGKQLQWESFVPDSTGSDNLAKSINLDRDYFFGLVLKGT